MRIIITRPEPFASQLAEKLKSAGFDEVVCLPCVDIQPSPPASLAQAVEGSDILIFISRNAVIHGHHLIQHEIIAAIGLGTKEELEQYHHGVDIFPQQPPFNSEALLALPALQYVNGKHIAIIRGDEGRELLYETLAARGANVYYKEVYRRALPDYDKQTLETALANPEQSLVICTSTELLKNLCKLAKSVKIDISRLQLCVISAKMADNALAMGFKKPVIIAESAQDKDILWIMRTWTKNLSLT